MVANADKLDSYYRRFHAEALQLSEAYESEFGGVFRPPEPSPTMADVTQTWLIHAVIKLQCRCDEQEREINYLRSRIR